MTTWPAAPADLPALEQTVHVWAVPLDDASVDLDGGRELLSPDERERAARFHFEQHRRRTIGGLLAAHERLVGEDRTRRGPDDGLKHDRDVLVRERPHAGRLGVPLTG